MAAANLSQAMRCTMYFEIEIAMSTIILSGIAVAINAGNAALS